MRVDDPPLAIHARYVRAECGACAGNSAGGWRRWSASSAKLEALPSEYRLWSSEDVAQAVIETAILGGERPAQPPGPQSATYHRVYLVHQLASAGRYREALAAGAHIVPSPVTIPSAAAHLGRGNAHAALGCVDEARREHALALAGQRALGSLIMVEYTAWVELLLVILPYRADDLAARAGWRLKVRAPGRRRWAWTPPRRTARSPRCPSRSWRGAGPRRGGWRRPRVASAIVGYAQGARVALGTLARHQGEPDARLGAGARAAPGGPGRPRRGTATSRTASRRCSRSRRRWRSTRATWRRPGPGSRRTGAGWTGAARCSGGPSSGSLRARHAPGGRRPRQARAPRRGGPGARHRAAPAARPPRRPPPARRTRHRRRARHAEAARAPGRRPGAGRGLRRALRARPHPPRPGRAARRRGPADSREAAARRRPAPSSTAGGAPRPRPRRRPRRPPRRPAPIALALPAGPDRARGGGAAPGRGGPQQPRDCRALFLSPRTVQRHVANAYPKIGAHNRADATAYACATASPDARGRRAAYPAARNYIPRRITYFGG